MSKQEREAKPQEEIKLKGKGEIFFNPSSMDILTRLALKDKLYPHPPNLLVNEVLMPEKLVLRGKEFPIDGWFLRRNRGSSPGGALRAVLFSGENMIFVKRLARTYPTLSEDKKFFVEEWYVDGKANTERLRKIVEEEKIFVPGTNIGFSFEI